VVTKVEEVIDYLRNVEARLDQLTELANTFRRELMEYAAKEAAGLRKRILEHARALQDRLLQEAVSQAEEASKEVLARGAWEAKSVRERATALRDKAEKIIIDAVLSGEIKVIEVK